MCCLICLQIPGTRGIAAVFKKGSHTEDTICHAERHWLTDYPDTCNLTRENGGMSWYCGKPKNRLLSCKDWSFTKYTSPKPVLPLTKAEEQMFKYVFVPYLTPVTPGRRSQGVPRKMQNADVPTQWKRSLV